MARWLGLCGADWHERSGVGDSCITMPLLLPLLLLLRGWPVAPSLARIVCVGVGGGRDLPESSRRRRRGVLGALWAADLQGGFSRGSDLTSPFRALSATLENALMGVGWGGVGGNLGHLNRSPSGGPPKRRVWAFRTSPELAKCVFPLGPTSQLSCTLASLVSL